MSTDAQGEDDLEQRVSNFLRRNFPQIQMHGGTAAIQNLDRESGSVTIQLGGACSGCGISPMTIQAIKSRMVKEIPEIDQVHAETGMMNEDGPKNEGGRGGGISSSGFPGPSGDADDGEDDEGPQAPF